MESQDVPRFDGRGNTVVFEDLEKLPYLKHIEIVKYTPKHFGIEKWQRLFVIPDHIMRRIYRHEVWKDTEIEEPKCENLTKRQRRLLVDWLKLHSPFRYSSTSNSPEQRPSRLKTCEDDDLRDLLDNSDDWYAFDGQSCDKAALNIAKCPGHVMQPESVIVKRAIEKMNHLNDEEEQRFQDLLKDKEYMNLLDSVIKDYLQCVSN